MMSSSKEFSSDDSDDDERIVKKDDSVRLVKGIDFSELKEKGATFQVEEPEINSQERNTYFDEVDLLKYIRQDDDDENSNPEDDDLSSFQKLAKEMLPLTEDKGVLKKILNKGDGKKIPEKSLVYVHYNGYIEDSPEPFDSTPLRGSQYKFRLQDGGVILGLDIAVSSMSKEEKAQFLISSDYAFGEMGCPPRIPANATLLFEVTLLHCTDNHAILEFEKLTEEEKLNLKFPEIVRVGRAEQATGNDYFRHHKYERAAERYLRAVHLLEDIKPEGDKEELEWKEVIIKNYLNLSLAFEKIGNYKKVIRYAHKAYLQNQKNAKALFRLGRAYLRTADYEKARSFLLKAQSIESHNQDISKELTYLNNCQKKFEITEKEMCQKMLKTSIKDVPIDNSKTSTKEIDLNNVSKEMKEIMDKYLEDFVNDPKMIDMTLPEGLSPEENTYFASRAKMCGLNIRHVVLNDSLRTKIYKLEGLKRSRKEIVVKQF